MEKLSQLSPEPTRKVAAQSFGVALNAIIWLVIKVRWPEYYDDSVALVTAYPMGYLFGYVIKEAA